MSNTNPGTGPLPGDTTSQGSSNNSTTSPPPVSTESSSSIPPPPPPSSTSSPPPPPPPSSTTSSSTSTSSTSTSSSTSSTPPPTTSTSEPPTTTPIVTVTQGNSFTTIEVLTSTSSPPTDQSTTSQSTPTPTPAPINPEGDGSKGGIGQTAKVAIGVVVPIAAIALLAVVGLWWWRKRRARRESEEERRKEVEDYSYNPNADPTIPSVGLGQDSYEMREDGAAGYRGWGSTTAGGSMGRKASTTMSGGMTAGTFSDNGAGHTRGNPSDANTEPTMNGSASPEGEILGAMGPSAANNRGADVRRGPSNASSSYSATGRSEGSAEGGVYPNDGAYYDQYGQNPYGEQRPQELPGQAVIRDNPARRNTRIENPAHYPQQSAGIAQNF